MATLAKITGRGGVTIDYALALWFPSPNSETGEDVAELQVHGGRAVIEAVFAALSVIEGLRPAEPGEFTRRAFENGKLDLTAVEGLADLVMAETEAQRRQSFTHMTGALARHAETWRQRLIDALALIEARIDFSDEADVPEDLVTPAIVVVRALENEIGAVLADNRRGERLREGLVVAIAGPPNAGKSTLLNRIARREAAIVSPYAGTTRDVIETHLDLDGWPVTLLDTAGIRDSQDPVEIEGVRRARERAAAADLVLWVIDASRPLNAQLPPQAGERIWLVQNKIDLVPEQVRERNEAECQIHNTKAPGVNVNPELASEVNKELITSNEFPLTKCEYHFTVSAVEGSGIARLIGQLASFAKDSMGGAEASLVTRERHRRALEETRAALNRALKPEMRGDEDLLAEELRIASRSLGRLTGRIDVEDVLDRIFRDFCVGK